MFLIATITRSSAFAGSVYDDYEEAETSDSENDPNVVNVNLASKELDKTIEKTNESLKPSEKARELLGVNSRRETEKPFNLHPELAECGREVIISGMNSDQRENLEGRYPNKGNCPLKAPELNPEVLPLLNKTSKSRDTYLAVNQDLSSRGLTALGQTLCAIFNAEEKPTRKTAYWSGYVTPVQCFARLCFNSPRPGRCRSISR